MTVETLNVDGMKRNRRLARAISDTGMAEFVRQLEYQCHWYGTEFRRVDRWYSVLQDVQRMRCREAVAAALGTQPTVQSLWL